MMTLLLMVRKDLLRKARAPLGLLVVLAFPIMFSAIIGMAFGGGELPRVQLLVENLDDNFLGNSLISALGSDQMARYFDVEIVGEEGLSRIEKGDGSALLRIPERFTEDLIEGSKTSLQLIRNPAQGIMPEIAEQLSGLLAEVLDTASRVLRGPLDEIAPYMRNEKDLDVDSFSKISVAAFQSVKDAGEFLFPPIITVSSVDLGETAGEDDDSQNAGFGIFQIFLFVFPGVSVYALFLAGDLAMRDILTESDAGTLRRQIQGPVSAGAVLRAKAAFSAILALASLLILTLIGWIAARASVDLPGYLLLSIALILAIVGSAATIYGAAGKLKRGSVISSIVYLLLAFAGGSFVSSDAMPGALRLIAPISPFYWGTQGYRSLLEDGATLGDLLPSILILAGMGIALLALGGILLNRTLLRRGGR